MLGNRGESVAYIKDFYWLLFTVYEVSGEGKKSGGKKGGFLFMVL